MIVKILSMQRVLNYGSFMQAYALKKVIESYGHTVTFCDFAQGTPRHTSDKVKKEALMEKLPKLWLYLVNPFKYIEKLRFRYQFKDIYKKSILKELGIDSNMNDDYSGDLMVIGSDEVFNYTQNHGFGYVPSLFGHNIQASSIISYAASAGYASVQDIDTDVMREELAEGFAKFDYLSVRDQNTYDFVNYCTNKDPIYVLDPTFLYDFAQEISQVPIPLRYILIYAYDGRLDAKEDVQKILNFAKSKALRTVSVGFYHEWCDENIVVTPFELLSVFKHANYVVTDTFHGTIFSIKNHKQFISLIREENRWGSNFNKLGFLLEQLNLTERINIDLDNLAGHFDVPIDYESVDRIIDELAKSSMQFLSNALIDAEKKRKYD